MTWIFVAVGCLMMSVPYHADAHHGGLGIEGDLVEWALNIDQWQDEEIDQGYRVKFLAYPRQLVKAHLTRLVFEIQAVTTGKYIGGLSMQIRVQAPDGTQQMLLLPETEGVTAYYETALVFDQIGVYELTAMSTTPGVIFRASFQRDVSANIWMGDWATLTGNIAVAAAFTITWVGLVIAIQRRFYRCGRGASLMV